MGNCIVFCAAEFDRLIAPISPTDYVIAADGGLRHTQALGIVPQEILGDFDSLGYTPAGARVFPVEKDDTDAMLAARRGLALGFRELLYYGSLDGKRLDHTVANYQTLQYLADHAPELDGYIAKYAKGWNFARIPLVASAVMRVAMYEILYMPDIPNGAAINEAVEIAKKYETPETVKFINGILGTFVRQEITE